MNNVNPPDVFSREAFAGRVYGVTGGAHGIGLATAAALARLGARVLLIDLNAENLAFARNELRAYAKDIHFVAADVTDDAAITAAIAQVTAQWNRLDGWVNNAFYSRRTLALDQPEVEFMRAWEVNCLAAWRISRQVFPMLARQRGSIVNISSIMSQQTAPLLSAYSSSKAALEGLTRSLAIEFAQQRVRVNAILPGYVLTYEGLNDYVNQPIENWSAEARTTLEWMETLTSNTQPLPESGIPNDLAQSILFLLSDGARFITGATLVVDGGLSVDLRDVGDERRRVVANRYKEVKPAIDAMNAAKNMQQATNGKKK